MLRRAVAVGLVACLHLAGLYTPLLHAHLDEHHDEHHDGRSLHAHWSAHAEATATGAAGPSVHADDVEDVVGLQVFLAVEAVGVVAPAIAVGIYQLPPVGHSLRRLPPRVAHGHDPPAGRPASSRAPPA